MIRTSRRGLTLMETMVAMGILLIMSAVVFESLRNSIEFHNLLAARDETVRTARAAFDRITRDLQLAYLTPNRGVPDRFQTVFVGLDEEPSKVFFATLNHQRLYLDSRECDQAEVTIWAEQAREEVGHGYVLFHRESPRIDQYPDEQGTVWPLAYNVRTFRLRYLDQATGEWKKEWDTRSADTPYRLPRAVEIGLVLIAPDPEDRTGEATVDVPFLEQVVIEYAERMPSSSGGASMVAGGGGGNSVGNGFDGAGVGNGFNSGGATNYSFFGNGGYGGNGASGLSGGPLGGMIGGMSAMNPANQTKGGKARRPPASGGSK